MSAPLIAPMETPAIQCGASPVLAKRLVHARLIGAERAAALQDEHRVLMFSVQTRRVLFHRKLKNPRLHLAKQLFGDSASQTAAVSRIT